MQRFEFLRQPLMGELAMSWREREKKEEKKMPFIVATYVYASSQGQRTHSARTNFVGQYNAYLMSDWICKCVGMEATLIMESSL